MAFPVMRSIDTATDIDDWAAGLLERVQAQAVRTSDAENGAFLQELVGQELTALMAGIDDPNAVENGHEPNAPLEETPPGGQEGRFRSRHCWPGASRRKRRVRG